MLHRLVRRNPHHLYRQSYPTTGTAPELYFDWKDVPSDYETMGSIKATPFGKTLEEAQASSNRLAGRKEPTPSSSKAS